MDEENLLQSAVMFEEWRRGENKTRVGDEKIASPHSYSKAQIAAAAVDGVALTVEQTKQQ